ncbi:putative glycoprotein [Shayang ascaridia galli virus 2]|uniref:Putative glycoprotein n=1 Tax=Shayang ascaridia galli virus 2 TaxID=1923460 RepID=A0A1L3KN41_9RHAB|nr:putative glycoprotein [Shayang ascaridia galli virus 2]APG78776.1 putative glycoprotein [Shayang ascaridia galli virus 2]
MRCKRLWLVVTIVSFLTGCHTQSWLDDPFGPVQHHSNPIWDCKTAGPGIVNPIPQRPNCAAIITSPLRRSDVVIQKWKVDLSSWTVAACECFTEIIHARCDNPLFGVPIKTHWVEFTTTSLEECINVCNDRSDKKMTQSGTVGVLTEDIKPEYKCPFLMGTSITTTKILSVSKLRLIVDHIELTVTGPVGFSRICKYTDEVCKTTKLGYVTWRKTLNLTSHCNLVPAYDPELCTIYGADNHLVQCPLSKSLYHLSDTSASMKTICMFKSTPAVVVKSLEGTWLSAYNQSITAILKLHSNTSRNLVRVDPNVEGLFAEVNSHLSWLAKEWLSRSREERIRVELGLCLDAQRLWDAAWNIRELVPQAAAAIWTGNQNAVATVFSGFILSWPCKQIYQYRFLMNPNCSENWPIEYATGISIETGFVEPVSFKITYQPGRMSCRVSPGFLLPINETHSLNLASRQFTPKPKSYFSIELSDADKSEIYSAPSLYTVSELGGTSRLEELVMLHHNHLRQAVKAVSGSYEIAIEEHIDQLAAVKSTYSLFGHWIGSTADSIVNSIAGIVSLCILIYITGLIVAMCVSRATWCRTVLMCWKSKSATGLGQSCNADTKFL